jgi:hypothetical protein
MGGEEIRKYGRKKNQNQDEQAEGRQPVGQQAPDEAAPGPAPGSRPQLPAQGGHLSGNFRNEPFVRHRYLTRGSR